MKQILIIWLATASISCAEQRTLSVSVRDGISHKPIVGAKVEYYGDADSIFSHAIEHNRRIILGFTNVDGTIEINTYPARELNQLFFLKHGYAPARVEWKDDEDVIRTLSPWTEDPNNIVGEGLAATVDARKAVTVFLFPYKSGVVPAPIHLRGISPDGSDDGRE